MRFYACPQGSPPSRAYPRQHVAARRLRVLGRAGWGGVCGGPARPGHIPHAPGRLGCLRKQSNAPDYEMWQFATFYLAGSSAAQPNYKIFQRPPGGCPSTRGGTVLCKAPVRCSAITCALPFFIRARPQSRSQQRQDRFHPSAALQSHPAVRRCRSVAGRYRQYSSSPSAPHKVRSSSSLSTPFACRLRLQACWCKASDLHRSCPHASTTRSNL